MTGVKIEVTVDCGDLYQILEWWTGNSQMDTVCMNSCVKQETRGP